MITFFQFKLEATAILYLVLMYELVKVVGPMYALYKYLLRYNYLYTCRIFWAVHKKDFFKYTFDGGLNKPK